MNYGCCWKAVLEERLGNHCGVPRSGDSDTALKDGIFCLHLKTSLAIMLVIIVPIYFQINNLLKKPTDLAVTKPLKNTKNFISQGTKHPE